MKIEQDKLVLNKNAFEVNSRLTNEKKENIAKDDCDYLLCHGKNLKKDFLFDALINHSKDHDELGLIISLSIKFFSVSLVNFDTEKFDKYSIT